MSTILRRWAAGSEMRASAQAWPAPALLRKLFRPPTSRGSRPASGSVAPPARDGRRLGVSEDWRPGSTATSGGDRTLLDAEIALRFSEFDTAEELYTQALDAAATNNERARSLAGLGQIAFERGEPRRAVQSLEQALSLSGAEASDQPSLADTLGRAYAMRDVEPAIRLSGSRSTGPLNGRTP